MYLAMFILMILLLYIRFIFLAKKCKYFYAKGVICEVGSFFFCGSDFKKFRPVGCDAMGVLRHQISPEYR